METGESGPLGQIQAAPSVSFSFQEEAQAHVESRILLLRVDGGGCFEPTSMRDTQRKAEG